MGDQKQEQKGDAGNAGSTNNDQKSIISQEDYNALKVQLDTVSNELKKTKAESDKIKETLLSPEFLARMEEGGRGSDQTLERTQTSVPDIDNMSRREFAEFLLTAVNDRVAKDFYSRQDILEKELRLMKAKEELAQVKAKYPDFDKLKDGITTRVQRGASYEDAYLAERQYQNIEKEQAEKEKAAKAASEKPGGVNYKSVSPADFKSSKQANDDAWERIVGGGKEKI